MWSYFFGSSNTATKPDEGKKIDNKDIALSPDDFEPISREDIPSTLSEDDTAHDDNDITEEPQVYISPLFRKQLDKVNLAKQKSAPIVNEFDESKNEPRKNRIKKPSADPTLLSDLKSDSYKTFVANAKLESAPNALFRDRIKTQRVIVTASYHEETDTLASMESHLGLDEIEEWAQIRDFLKRISEEYKKFALELVPTRHRNNFTLKPSLTNVYQDPKNFLDPNKKPSITDQVNAILYATEEDITFDYSRLLQLNNKLTDEKLNGSLDDVFAAKIAAHRLTIHASNMADKVCDVIKKYDGEACHLTKVKSFIDKLYNNLDILDQLCDPIIRHNNQNLVNENKIKIKIN